LDARFWIDRLGLEKHPEGGYFKETYRSEIELNLPGYGGPRNASTAIYYLLDGQQFSAFHRIKSDEVWHFYAGSPLILYVIDDAGNLHENKLGNNPDRGEALQTVVKAYCWFAASVSEPDSFSLVGCTVSPGFDFRDLEMGRRADLIRQYPQHSDIIGRYTR
jgi:hypothetical protein